MNDVIRFVKFTFENLITHREFSDCELYRKFIEYTKTTDYSMEEVHRDVVTDWMSEILKNIPDIELAFKTKDYKLIEATDVDRTIKFFVSNMLEYYYHLYDYRQGTISFMYAVLQAKPTQRQLENLLKNLLEVG